MGQAVATLELQLIHDVARLRRDLDQSQRNITGFTGAAAQGAAGLSRAFQALGGVIAGAISIQAVRSFLELADQSKQISSQLKLATAASGSFAKAQEDVKRITAETRGDLTATATLYATFARSAGELGINQAQVATITKTVNQAFKVSGASGAEASGSIRQLSQAFASGVLRGDEFNSMMEGAPRLAKLLADSLGVPMGSLRAMAEEGELTADKLVRALSDKKYTAGLEAEMRQMPVTFDEAMGQIHNAAVITFGAFDRGGQFSNMLATFVLDGAGGFAEMERAAESLGVSVRSEMEGVAAAFGPVIESIKEAVGWFNTLNTSSQGSKSFVEGSLQDIDRWTGWALGTGKQGILGGGSNLSGRFRATRDSESRNLTANLLNDRINSAMNFQGNGNFRGDVSAPQHVAAAAAADKRTAATKKLTDAERAHRQAVKDAQRDHERAIKTAEDYAKSLEEQAAKFGKSSIEIQRMEVAAKAAAAPTAELAKRIVDAGAALEKLQVDKAAADFNQMLKAIEDEGKLLGLVGPQREQAALMLEKEAYFAANLGRPLNEVANEWMRIAIAKQGNIDKAKALADEAKSAEKLADELDRVNVQLDDMIGVLDGIGGLAGTLGGVLGGLQTGNFAGLGAAGGLLNIALSNDGDYERQAQLIASRISDVFGVSGPFAQMLATALQGATTGSLAASLVGNGSKGAQLGGMAGGALGQAFVGDILGKGLTKALGSFAGPLGAIAGGVLGSIFGGIFKKTPTGSVILGQGGIVGTSGNGGRDAGGLGSNVVQSLDQIAKALGATVGQYKVSIGMRGDSYKVDPTGRGRTKESDVLDFGQDAQAAVLAAVKDAIGDGVFQGLSDGVKKALETGDLETQLQKIAAFLAVPDQLAQMKDPSGYAAAQLEKELSGLRDIYAEMGASADQYSQLAEFEALKRAELVKQADTTNDALELERTRRGMEAELLRLSGDEIGALAATRQLEREQIAPSLQGLYDLIAARHDEIAAQQEVAAAAQAAAEIEKARVALRIEILEEQGRAEDALVLKRQQQRDATEAQLHSELTELFAAQDAAKEAAAAQQALTEATNAAAAAVQAEAEIEKARQSLRADLLEAEGRADEALTIRRMQQLAALDPLLRAEQQAVWSAERAAEAQRALADAQAASAAAADRISDLQKRLFTVQGNTAAVQQIERAREMAGAQTEAERAMLRSIYAAEDLVNTQSTLTDAYTLQAGAMTGVIEKMREASRGLREFANELYGKDTIGDTDAMRRQVLGTMKMAGMGDQAAIGRLPDLINSYLPQAMKSAGSMSDYLREVSLFGQGSRDVADVNDSRANVNDAYLRSYTSGREVDPDVLAELLAQIDAKLAALNQTTEAGNEQRKEQTGYVKKSANRLGQQLAGA